MAPHVSVRSIIDLWRGRQALASDLTADGGAAVSVDRVHKWAAAGAIPAHYHARILRAAASRGYAITAEDLVSAHDKFGGEAA